MFFSCRAEGEITELEEKFKASNPQIVQRIRFGNKDESERLLEKVDERAKQCKQLAKVSLLLGFCIIFLKY